MAEWLRHGLSIGRTEYRRSVRGLREDRTQLAMIGLGTLVTALGSLAVAAGIVLFGDELAGAALPPSAGGWVAVMWGFVVYMYASRAASQENRIDAEPLMLTTTSPRAVATGIVGAEVVRGLSYLGAPLVVVTCAFAYATASPLVLVTAPATFLAFLGTAALVGYGIGIAVALAIARSPFVARYKTHLTVVLLVVVLPPIFFAFSGRLDYALLSWVPLAWYADLLVLGAPVEGSTLRAAGALGVTAAIVAVAGTAVDRLTVAYWYADPVEVDDGPRQSSASRESSLEATLGRAAGPLAVLGRPSRTVVVRALLQTRRNPSKLWFQFVVVVGFVPSLVSGGGGWPSPRLVSGASAFVLPWLAGSAFGANVLGDEGDVLPATLTSSITGREYVRGFLAVAALVGLPLTALAVVGAGIPAPYDAVEVAGLLALGVAALAASAPLALALGMRFPRFAALSGGWGDREVVPPSLTAMVLHVLTVFVVGGLGAIAWLSPEAARWVAAGLVWLFVIVPAALLADRGLAAASALGEWGQGLADAVGGVADATVQAVGYGGALVVFLLVAALSYRYAVRRFDAYTVD